MTKLIQGPEAHIYKLKHVIPYIRVHVLTAVAVSVIGL
jgi:hypothetical protein